MGRPPRRRRLMARRHWALVVLVAVIGAAATAAWGLRPPPPGAFTFGLWGDMPYAKANDGPKIPALIADMNADHLAFTAFDGDIKDGGSLCSDDQYTAAAMHPVSVVRSVLRRGDAAGAIGELNSARRITPATPVTRSDREHIECYVGCRYATPSSPHQPS